MVGGSRAAPLAGYMGVRLDACVWNGAGTQILLDISVTTQRRSGAVEHQIRREYTELVDLERELLRIGHLVKARLVPLDPKSRTLSPIFGLDDYAAATRALLSRAVGRTETAQWTSPAVVREFLRTQDRLLGTRRPKMSQAVRPLASEVQGPTGEHEVAEEDSSGDGDGSESPSSPAPSAKRLLGRVLAATDATGFESLGHLDGDAMAARLERGFSLVGEVLSGVDAICGGASGAPDASKSTPPGAPGQLGSPPPSPSAAVVTPEVKSGGEVLRGRQAGGKRGELAVLEARCEVLTEQQRKLSALVDEAEILAQQQVPRQCRGAGHGISCVWPCPSWLPCL